ncbi:MAG: TIGR02206 family membrane protein [Candidatus Marinimicrobia bacterium]|jgi:hypothetical integral membrane protein (TIGR02206 family)|nr:TIGR02206 family membrane protein [Candidatus Neomarinimicrobiota bacterium]MBT3838373.1 TIGR02206 family membrane protein [Candidatus Neomarinimicrobiota bacterium]MBT3998678.1 TIGR02206 family membrane protein [Candidatus Neomarinimicrobiota bacterium]MBT4283257.1 TIGR02206 family membrane protein [Candidatus Neomarinimicrobiota bacterium]MBT4578430.1 TIGR02206 family membrane protein [Candidatus Neomarinimicrobiota bacterium]
MIKDIINILLSLPSQHVIYGSISTVSCIAGIWIYSQGSKRIKSVFLQTISWLVIVNEVAYQVNMFYYGLWDFKISLPLEMCYLTALLIPVYFKYQDSRPLQNWFFFAGFAGSFTAFLNTNLSEMAEIYMSIHYFIAHGFVIFIMLTLVIDNYRPRWSDFFNAVQWTSTLVISIIVFNLIIGSNYMFTQSKPPGVNFAMLMPEWPYYFIIMLVMGLVFYALLMLIALIPIRKKINTP